MLSSRSRALIVVQTNHFISYLRYLLRPVPSDVRTAGADLVRRLSRDGQEGMLQIDTPPVENFCPDITETLLKHQTRSLTNLGTIRHLSLLRRYMAGTLRCLRVFIGTSHICNSVCMLTMLTGSVQRGRAGRYAGDQFYRKQTSRWKQRWWWWQTRESSSLCRLLQP